MAKRIYVGNLPFSASDDEVRSMFSSFGKVVRVELGRGSATVEMADERAANLAIQKLHRSRMGGKSLNVNEARTR